MTGHTNRLLVAATSLLPLLLSCEKEKTEGTAGRAQLVLNTGISGTTIYADTKGAVSGNKFAKDKTIGLCICVHEDSPTLFEPHLMGYGNIRATSTDDSGDSWAFYNGAINVTVPALYLTSRQDHKKADIYAYSPYMEGVSDVTAIPVDFSKNQDIMYATQNGSGNRDLDPEINATINVPLTFVHLMSRLRFGFKLEYAGSNHLMDYITIKKTESKTTPIYSGGTFNALNGSISATYAEDLTVRFGGIYERTPEEKETYGLFSDATAYRYFDFLLYPTVYAANDDLTVVFSIDGFQYEYPIKLADVLHSDGTTCGFRPGYSYDFKFQFDNYVHLKDITIQTDWTEDTLEDVI